MCFERTKTYGIIYLLARTGLQRICRSETRKPSLLPVVRNKRFHVSGHTERKASYKASCGDGGGKGDKVVSYSTEFFESIYNSK